MLAGILAVVCVGTALYKRGASCALRLNVDIRLPSGQVLVAEMSDTWPLIERGMMDRPSLPAGTGMLFVYPNVGRHRHWMYRCLIPLDIIWLSSDKRIVEIITGAPPCPKEPCRLFGLNSMSRYVLELAAGEAARLRLRTGDQLEFWTVGFRSHLARPVVRLFAAHALTRGHLLPRVADPGPPEPLLATARLHRQVHVSRAICVRAPLPAVFPRLPMKPTGLASQFTFDRSGPGVSGTASG